MTGLVVLLAGLAAAVAVGPPAASALRRLEPVATASESRRRLPVALVVPLVGVALAGLLGGLRWAGWALAAGIAVGTLGWVLRSAARQRVVRRGETEVAQAATALALLLRTGHLPARALSDAARDSPCLAPVAAVAALGGDVGGAFQQSSTAPGHGGLAAVAAAWQVSGRTGAPVASLLAEVAEGLRRDREVADLVEAELSSARASGRIMAALPFVAIGLGIVVGADPLGFLFSDGLGQVVFIVGLALAAVGVVWTERIAAAASTGLR